MFVLQDKNVLLSGLNKDFLELKDELKETKHKNQIMEKQLLKTQEDFEMVKSKFETFKDIEIVRFLLICWRQFIT